MTHTSVMRDGSTGDRSLRDLLDMLLTEVSQGDEIAFARLYDRSAGIVFGLAARVLRDRTHAEEVTQEVLLEVWRTAAQFDPERGSALAWITTMARRRSVDRIRSLEASRRRERASVQAQFAHEFDEVTEAVEARLEYEEVRVALLTLTELQRETLELIYFVGLTCAQTAEVLDAPIGTVKSRLQNGLVRLRTRLSAA